jgi:hypothetical protein
MNKETNTFQILVTNIFWNVKSFKPTKTNKNPEFEEQITLDVPEGVLKEAEKKGNMFNDIIEQFVYNLLYRKYGCEVNRCQIWLPLED